MVMVWVTCRFLLGIHSKGSQEGQKANRRRAFGANVPVPNARRRGEGSAHEMGHPSGVARVVGGTSTLRHWLAQGVVVALTRMTKFPASWAKPTTGWILPAKVAFWVISRSYGSPCAGPTSKNDWPRKGGESSGWLIE